MSANVETMFSVREKPWHGLGIIVQDAPTSKEAITLAGLDWTVENRPIYDAKGNVINGYVANTRSSDDTVLGIVTKRYSIVQNTEAFEFTDNLISEDVKYECAGSLRNGKQIWLLAKMPDRKILGDDIEPYICFTNTHDGSGAIKVCMTPVRVVCNNTLNLALKTAKRSWSTRHVGDIQGKLDEARQTLGLAEQYMNALVEEAEMLVTKTISDMEIEAIFDKIYQKPDLTDLQKARNDELKGMLFNCLEAPDIRQFRGTQYGLMMAVTDMVDHRQPQRQTATIKENTFNRIMNGHSEVDAFYQMIA